uniref:Uncharacterized protein n=1 Tax=Aquisalinus luteolus TaxID=1566827 RepID=A0A8J3A3N4_9PROT|nr:hypothetical protein GCM10011355_15560 [Aquisalinus luteolus]
MRGDSLTDPVRIGGDIARKLAHKPLVNVDCSGQVSYIPIKEEQGEAGAIPRFFPISTKDGQDAH